MVASGFFELIARRAVTSIIVYSGCGKLFVTRSTFALLIINLLFFLLRVLVCSNRLLCVSRLKPSSVYPTNDLLFSGAYGGSRYTKSFSFIFSKDSSKLL